MATRVLLLRAINVGPRRLPMAALRDLLTGAGWQDVRTYLQSGNVVVTSDAPPETLAARAREIISGHCGFDVPVIVRTDRELEAVVAADPFGAAVTEPKRFWVSFLERSLADAERERLVGLLAGQERLVMAERELYAWLPDGGGRSKLGTALGAPAKGLTATARNWRTVAALLEMCAP